MITIGMIGPETCFKKTEAKELLFKIKQTYGSTATVFSGGNQEGVERDIRKYALEFGLKYKEFNPSFTGSNGYSFLPESYFKKNYHFSHFGHRYEEMLRRIDRLVVFEQADDKKWKIYESLIKKAEKKGIKTMIL